MPAVGDGSHHAVLDPVVDHLHEVAGTRRATVQPAVFRRDDVAGTVRRSRHRVDWR